MSFTAERYHDFSYGHRVHGHEGKCRHLHGHNGRVTFVVEAADGLDDVGRVMDFSVIKAKLCQWLEDNWDHKFLVWEEDPLALYLLELDPTVVRVPFNPTAENMAQHLVEAVAPLQLEGTGCRLISAQFEETRKCSATYYAKKKGCCK
jgi:6-pyruvoyltetrahydropterin/6-carboxytetrahydropterin synthase